MWYNEISQYNWGNPGFTMETGHYSQVVLKSSTQVGFGIATAGDKSYVVAQYFPSGNFSGQFPQNVVPNNKSTTNSGDNKANNPNIATNLNNMNNVINVNNRNKKKRKFRFLRRIIVI